MAFIHITDASKAGLVMTSEIFKDKLQGSMVTFALTGADCLKYFQNLSENLSDTQKIPDMCIVDFELPDTDGVTLIRELRKIYNGPILLTAYPDKVVQDAVKEELFAFNDCFAWVPKPVRFAELEKRIDQFLIHHHRLARRFPVTLQVDLQGKTAGKTKKPAKIAAKIVNISLGGICVEMPTPKLANAPKKKLVIAKKSKLKAKVKPVKEVKLLPPVTLKMGQELTFLLDFSGSSAILTTQPPKKTVIKKTASKKNDVGPEKIKGKVAWQKENGKFIGLEFSKISEAQKKSLEGYLKTLLVP